jgi:hypothetical protein
MSGFDIQQPGDLTLKFIDKTLTTNAIEIGRGTTDTDITYIALRNASGTLCYVYPNASANGITVSSTKP